MFDYCVVIAHRSHRYASFFRLVLEAIILRECIRNLLFVVLEDNLKTYVNNFKLNIFDYHDYENFDMFKTENRLLFKMLSCGKDKKKMQKLLEEEKEYREADEESARAILGILGVELKLEEIRKKDKDGKEKYDMCKAIEDMRKDERREGRREGALEMALKNVKNLMKNQKITCEEAMNMMGISKKMQKKIEMLV